MPRNSVAIVVLNYLNYSDTFECVDSILSFNYDLCGIIVVDNGSDNESFSELKIRFGHYPQIHLLQSGKNLGYAKGNNIGISFARKKLGASFVLVVNNDTIFTDPDYIEVLLSKYQKGIGCIGSQIVLKAGYEQGEYVENISIKDVIYYYLNIHSSKHGSSFDFPVDIWSGTKVLHGSAIMFTPDFFRYYKGFYPRTFLFGEEAIVYYMCKCKSLEQLYVPDTSIYHKEDQSSIMSINNDETIMNEYQWQSRKYVLLWAIRYKLSLTWNKEFKK